MNVLQQRAESCKLLSRKFNHKEGVLKFNIHNTLEHELAKFLVCWELAKQDKQFVSEAVFENGRRADVFVLDDKEAIEILVSETKEMLKEKIKEYPVPVFDTLAKEQLARFGVILNGSA